MRWVYTQPEKKIAVSDGLNTWLHMQEEEVVYKGSVASWKSRGAFAVLAGGSLVSRYQAREISAERASVAGNVLMVLVPKKRQDDFVELEIEIRPQRMEIASITAIDAMGNRIGFLFKGVKENVPAPRQAFEFTPPPGVEIVEQD